MKHHEFGQIVADCFSHHLQSISANIAYGALEYRSGVGEWWGECERVDFGAALAELCWHDGDTDNPTPTVTMFADQRGVTALIVSPDTVGHRTVIHAHYRKGGVTIRVV